MANEKRMELRAHITKLINAATRKTGASRTVANPDLDDVIKAGANLLLIAMETHMDIRDALVEIKDLLGQDKF